MSDPQAVHNGDDDSQRYFCYQCNKEVAVEGSQDAMTCTECDGGFLEAIATVNPEFRRPSRRRRRRAAHGDTNTISLSDALEHMYPHQMLQMVHVLLEAARTNNRQPTDAATQEDGPTFPPTLEEGELALAQSERSTEVGTAENDGRVVIVRDRQLGHDDNSEEAESDSETGGLRLELEGFDLNEDDDEWEEAEEEEDGVGNSAPGTRSEDVAEESGDREERVRRARSNLTFYMRELFQNLMDQNVEVRLELPDVYLGNPGDYLDSRGFEQLLQQLAENDNTRRGAPPAAKSAVDKLDMVTIRQDHIDSGIAVCAICKEHLMLDEPAKQLPCLHLYHQECILPWLSSRNSCPVCRYELPTDDPDYEEQKKSRRPQNSGNGNPTAGVAEGDNNSDRGQNSGGSSVSASEEVCRDDSGSDIVVDSEVMRVTSSEDPQGETGRGISRSWLILAVGPVLSVMGFMFISLANHLVGRQLDRLQLNPFQEFQMFPIGGSSEVPGQRHWWSFH